MAAADVTALPRRLPRGVQAEDLLSVLPRGPENGTSVPVLASRFGADERTIRNRLDDLVEADHPVCTLPLPGGRSIYLARTPEELDAAIEHLEHKRDSTSVRIALLKNIQRKMRRKLSQQLKLAV